MDITGSMMNAMTGSGAANKPSNDLGRDEFFQILAAQLQNQNPMEPMDNKDFIAQLAQFSSLEQIENLAKGFDELSETVKDYMENRSALDSVLQSSSLVGKYAGAEVEDSQVAGRVDAVRIKESVPYAVINGKEVPVSSITKIEEFSGDGSESDD